jgi:hypothetical protein
VCILYIYIYIYIYVCVCVCVYIYIYILMQPFQVDLKHIDQEKGSNVVDVGIDLKEYYLSVEWDILAVPATRCQCCKTFFLRR